MTEPASETLPTQGRWHRPDPRGRARWAIPSGVVLAIALLGVGAARLAYLEAGVVAGLFVLGSTWAADTVTWPATAADLRLLEDPDDPEVCLVEVRIVVDHKTIGRDRGAVWFEDGRLLFSGHRTSFALGGEDVVPSERWRDMIPGRQRMPGPLVPVLVPGRVVYVTFVLIRRGDGVRMRQEMNFVKRLGRFRKLRPKAEGLRELPPLER